MSSSSHLYSSAPPSSAPSSPKKQLLRTLLTGVTPIDPSVPAKRWGKSPPLSAETAPPSPTGSGKVKSLVKDYEEASLVGHARPYHAMPASPTRSQHGSDQLLQQQQQQSHSPTVPASFFQHQRAVAGPRAMKGSEEGEKENLRRFSPTKPASKQLYPTALTPASPLERSRTPASFLSMESAESAVSSQTSAENAQVQRARVVSIPAALRPGGGLAPQQQTSQPARQERQSSRKAPPQHPQHQRTKSSTFVEAIPSPPRNSPAAVPYSNRPPPSPTRNTYFQSVEKPLPAPAPKEEMPPPPPRPSASSGSRRQRAQTMTSASPPSQRDSGRQQQGRPQINRATSRGMTASVSAESFPSRPKSITEAFSLLLDDMHLPAQSTVRSKMMALPDSLKQDMLTSSISKSTSTSLPRPKHSRALSQSVGSSSSLFDSDEPAPRDKQVKEKRSIPFLRKVRSSVSLKGGKDGGKDDMIKPQLTGGPSATGEDATYWAVRIRSATMQALDPKEVGRLRGRLRGESPTWVDEFLKHGGYSGLLDRLQDLLDVEWREEQHDDQLLFEVLKCLKALASTTCGTAALASRSPTPFVALSGLLFSEKRPGDIPCRQLLVEMIHLLFIVAPSSAAAITPEEWARVLPVPDDADASTPRSRFGSGGERRYVRPMKDVDAGPGDVLALVTSLMIGPPNEKEERKVDFMKETYRQRRFKLWVVELADCVRDYFWVFCHSQNQFWTYDPTQVEDIEAPKVPSGMTGGVESEAMAYAAAHFKLINAIAAASSTRQAAFDFFSDLYESGLERLLLTFRRASQAYYPVLHLELARFVAVARNAGFNLGPKVLSLIERSTLSRDETAVLRDFLKRQAGAVQR